MIDFRKSVDDLNTGYFISKLKKKDYNLIKDLVEDHFKFLINKKLSIKEDVDFDNYLSKVDQSKHHNLFNKTNRILPKKSLQILMNKLDLFKEIKKIFKDFRITDEENLGFGNFYWRIVRPFPNKDVGTMHKDKWFWDLGTGKLDEKKFKRYKLWISITGDSKLGLKFVPGSPNKNFNYDFKFSDGKKNQFLMKLIYLKMMLGLWKEKKVHLLFFMMSFCMGEKFCITQCLE